MIGKWFDDDGKIVAYAEYNIVDSRGDFALHGDYCFIHDVWIHDEYRNKGILKRLLMQERNRYPNVTYIYWTRGKYKKRMSRYEIKEIIHGRRRYTCSTADTTSST